MINIKLKTPIAAHLADLTSTQMDRVKKYLTYTNKAATHGISRLKRNQWLLRSDPTEWQRQMDELKEDQKKCLLKDGVWTYSGLIEDLSRILKQKINLTREFDYPEFRPIPWKTPVEFKPRPYQISSIKKLLDIKHGGVELSTGSGKSYCIMALCKEMGLRAAVVTPSTSIFKGLLRDFEKHLGTKHIGMYGNGKKQTNKLITICVSKSLTMLIPGSEEYGFFSSLDVVIVDEAHTFAAKTLERVCHGVFANVPYRFFFSATQTRNDGGEKLLKGIVGPIVEELTPGEAMKKGYLAKLKFRIISTTSTNSGYYSSDDIAMKRKHFLQNDNICRLIADIANRSYKLENQQTLILVEDLNQIHMLSNLLTVPFDYAHGTKGKKGLEKIGLVKTDVQEKVDEFNKGKTPVLIGTSAVSTGTNFKPVNNLVMWQGGTSSIAIPQGLGRGTRLDDKKEIDTDGRQFTNIWDFRVTDISKMVRQVDKRIVMYNEIWPEINEIPGWV